MDDREKVECVRLLHELGCSCVLSNGKNRWVGRERGVKDLLYLLESDPVQLRGVSFAIPLPTCSSAAPAYLS